MLSLREVSTGYGAVSALRGVTLTLSEGEILTVVGANGAGKSTLLKTISGVVRPWRGRIELNGEQLSGLSVESIVSRGIVQIPEGRQLFGSLSVEENLELGGYSRRKSSRSAAERIQEVYTLFPRLLERRRQEAGTLSGGEQQMLAIGRALMAEPKVLLLDEPSMGLAPLVVKEIFSTLKELNRGGLAMLLVEQDARIALSLADRGLVLERGRIVLQDTAEALLNNSEVQSIYFGRNRQGGGAR